jgi:hypothetical protein
MHAAWSTRLPRWSGAFRGVAKNSIDHSPGAHDNVANVVAGLAHCAVNRRSASVTELRISRGFFLPIEPVCLRLESDTFASPLRALAIALTIRNSPWLLHIAAPLVSLNGHIQIRR